MTLHVGATRALVVLVPPGHATFAPSKKRSAAALEKDRGAASLPGAAYRARRAPYLPISRAFGGG
ncbi:hypothetical protein [Polyangium mundeleinium]|uniref:Uncharacterized protein n=1 Tax=Polyangium mundeleinium TaxID=2995306 RepID=A0ABT5ENJ9_9BACT|nr:hypothetical protein [Polyangium mundeleinium]MDC0743415.1 hypothetical protein [Polyangium mundeleinium]